MLNDTTPMDALALDGLTVYDEPIAVPLKGRRPWLGLLSAVMHVAGGKAELLRHAERPWASVTFSGSRHTIALQFTGLEAVAAGEAYIAMLPDHEFTLPRILVADAAIVASEYVALPVPCLTVEAELLLLEES